MAPVTKPGTAFQFAITPQLIGGRWNIIEPPGGLKDTGWAYQQKPPRNYENWCFHSLTEWAEWWTAQAEASGRPATKTVAAEDSTDVDKQAADVVIPPAADAGAIISATITLLGGTGGTVLLAAGTYLCTTPINVVQAGVCLRGQGPSTEIKWNSAAACNGLIWMDGNTRGAVEALRLSSVAGATYVNGVAAFHCRGLTIRDVVVDRLYGAPSVLPATPKGVGFFLHDCEAALAHNYVRLLTLHPGPKSGAAILADTTSLTLIDDLIVDDQTWIAPPGGSDYTPEPAIILQGGVHLVSHVFARYAGGGIAIHGGNASVVSDCRFDDVDGVGINIDGAVNVRVHGNSILAGTGVGILMAAGSDNGLVIGNEINTAGSHGIELAGDADSAVGNLVKDCANGILMSGDGNAARDNTITGSTNVGVNVTGADSQVHGNRIFGGDTGIELGGVVASCVGNHLRAQDDYMIHIKQACTNALISSNLGMLDGVVDPGCCIYHAHNSERKNMIIGNQFYGVGTLDCWIQGDFHNVNGGVAGATKPNFDYHDAAGNDQEHTLLNMNLFSGAVSEAA